MINNSAIHLEAISQLFQNFLHGGSYAFLKVLYTFKTGSFNLHILICQSRESKSWPMAVEMVQQHWLSNIMTQVQDLGLNK